MVYHKQLYHCMKVGGGHFEIVINIYVTFIFINIANQINICYQTARKDRKLNGKIIYSFLSSLNCILQERVLLTFRILIVFDTVS